MITHQSIPTVTRGNKGPLVGSRVFAADGGINISSYIRSFNVAPAIEQLGGEV